MTEKIWELIEIRYKVYSKILETDGIENDVLKLSTKEEMVWKVEENGSMEGGREWKYGWCKYGWWKSMEI